MLHAQKDALRTQLKASLVYIRQLELQFYTNNCSAIGTNALFLTSFAWWGLIETTIPESLDHANEASKTVYLVITAMIMMFELQAAVSSTLVAILGPALALRGPDGAMHTAIDGMITHYRFTLACFALGLFFIQLSVISFMHMHLLRLRAETMVTGDFAGGQSEVADSMALPPHELAKMVAVQATWAAAKMLSRDAPPLRGISWLRRARAR
ncbi:hypothetical protein T492DRAFT_1148118 [Pavlovales sp. CCMP2436]|nr:hypothetical protein T492DRAFT_1148118 [Pavlovales sp. CCMP2436]